MLVGFMVMGGWGGFSIEVGRVDRGYRFVSVLWVGGDWSICLCFRELQFSAESLAWMKFAQCVLVEEAVVTGIL